ncbi:Rho GTPase activation protein [Lactifluus subvellereus]|nr:Rho GTPase activation protein [Lactifluus subvellereus]
MATEQHRDHRDAKAGLRTWLQQFTTAQRPRTPAPSHIPPYSYPHAPGDYGPPPGTVFGRPLKDSLKCASVQISTADASGKLYVWGYIPVVVAKWYIVLFCPFVATEVRGTFRQPGSEKRTRDLQAVFETPPRYGKSLDWKQENYTSYDVATVFCRYLSRLPEPVIPYDLYFPPYNQETVIATYKRLIHSMAHANQYLLLYVLDLLSVFARKSDKNLMTAHNLAVVFRPGLMGHPEHKLERDEHRLSQDVLEFLIVNQDWFMLDNPPPPALPPTPSRSLTPPLSPHSAGASVSDDEGPDGWRIIERHQRLPGERAKHGAGPSPSQTTTTNKGEKGKERAQMPPPVSGITYPGIIRSRTVPTTRKGRPSTADSAPALLRKARRTSTQPV